MSTSDYKNILKIAENDVEVLVDKGKSYGDSWKKRGGVGAFMMLARKWDRIENIASQYDYNIFAAGADNAGGVLDDIADLRRYLLLVEDEVDRIYREGSVFTPLPDCPPLPESPWPAGDAGPAYVDQG